MREIKFRVWVGPFRRYAPVTDLDFTSGTVGYLTYDEEIEEYDYHDVVIMEEIVIEQYTGFKDKDGVEIYEGDILSGLGIVKMVHGIFEPVAYFKESVLEVVGNIHENPELLGLIE